MTPERIAIADGPNRRVHKFAIAGLGAGPYAFLGVTTAIFRAAPDAPAQPGTCCDYCGTGIMFVFHLRSSDGHSFKVGSDCIHKTEDTTLIGEIAEAERAHRRQVTEDRETRQIAEFAPHLESFLASFVSEPHPNQFYASQGKTKADYLRFCWTNSGRSGRAQYARRWLKAVR